MKKLMRSIAVLCLTLLGATFSSAQVEDSNETILSATVSDEGSVASMESYLDGAVEMAMKVYDVPGFTVSVVRDNKKILSKGYGHIDLARQLPVDPSTSLFRVASISKTVTWTAMMQMVEQSKLDLDADVNTYLKKFKIPATYDAPITLRHIMSHTTGFEDGGLGYLFIRDENKLLGQEAFLKKHMPKRVREPGTYASYSNYATALAGYIVGQVSGVDFDSYVEQNVFDPLGMNHSTFREPVPESIAAGQSANFRRELGGYIDWGFEYVHGGSPGAAMSSTADDIANFMLAYLNKGALNGRRILEPKSVDLMLVPLHAPHSALASMLHGFYETKGYGYRGYGHGGNTVIFHSEMTLLPAKDMGFFISSNAPEGAQAVRQISAHFWRSLHQMQAVGLMLSRQ